MKRMWSKKELKEIVKGTKGYDIANLVDKNGHVRFIDFVGAPLQQEGFTASYCKASLSGSHLLIVLAFSIANATEIASGAKLMQLALPKSICDKIYPVWHNSRIETKVVTTINDDWSTQNLNVVLSKRSNPDGLDIVTSGAYTATKDRSGRVAFDLLIDNDQSTYSIYLLCLQIEWRNLKTRR